MITLENKEQFIQAQNGKNTVLYFSANWCGDCLVLAPSLPAIESNFPQYTFYYCDRDLFIDECIELEILGIPSFLIFNEGEEKGRFVSKFRKTKEEVIDFINRIEG